MIRAIVLLAPLLLLQDPGERAVALHREVERHARKAGDPEVQQRVGKVADVMRDAARKAAGVEDADGRGMVLKLYDVRAIVTIPKSRPCPEF